MSSLDQMTFNSKTDDFCLKTEPADGENTVNKTNIKSSESLSNFCQTCLTNKRNSKLKNMTQRHHYNGKYELYSEMIDYCFSLQPRRNYHNNVYMICEPCISKLREVVDFRNQVEDAQINIKLNIELPSLSLTTHRDVGKNVEDEFELIDNEISRLLYDNDSRDPFSTVDKETQFITDSILDDENEDSIGTTISKQYDDDNFVDANFVKYVTSKENPTPAVISCNSLPYKLNPRQLKCKMCGVTFDTHCNLQNHMPSHFPNFSCEICRKVFADHKQLGEHEWHHQNEKIECQGKRFKIRSNKNVLMRRKHEVDDGIYKHPSTVTKKPSTKNSKNINTSLHGNIKSDMKLTKRLPNNQYARNECLPYKLDLNQLKCKICIAQFESHQELQKHMPSHFPNFTCETCGRVFANRKQITSHKRLQHQNEIIECPLCPEKRFKNRAYKSVHMKRFHGVPTAMKVLSNQNRGSGI